METDTPTRGVRPSLFGRAMRDFRPSASLLRGGAFVSVTEGETWSRVPGRSGLRITGVWGQLWVTQANEASDEIVSAGDEFATRMRGKVVVQAMSDATFRVEDGA